MAKRNEYRHWKSSFYAKEPNIVSVRIAITFCLRQNFEANTVVTASLKIREILKPTKRLLNISQRNPTHLNTMERKAM